MPVTRLDIARYKRLALRRTDVWQGGLVRLPAWVDVSDDEPPYRPQGAFWRSARTGLVWVEAETEPGTADAGLAIAGLITFAKKHERELLGRPSRIEVTSAAFADELRALLDDPDTTIAVVENLPEVRAALKDLAEYNDGLPAPLGLLDVPGTTVPQLRAFADAAGCFYRAAPWDALDPEDLLVVESPAVPPSMRHVVVTGSTPDMRGLMCFASPRTFERLGKGPSASGKKPAVWFVAFGPIDELPFSDVDAWTDLDLPVAGAFAYPRPGRPEGVDELERPDAQHLAGLEAILRGIAESSDEDFDSGRWIRNVTTSGEPVELHFSLPNLLEGMADPAAASMTFSDGDTPVAAKTPADQAHDLAYAAMSAEGRLARHLARRALAIFPDCADAWGVLADHTRDLTRATDLYRLAVIAGQRTLSPDVLATKAGEFWALIETRPYMRARLGLAECLDAAGAMEEAIEHYRELLRLNPNDNQAVRQPYLLCLLEADRGTESQALIEAFKHDERPDWLFAAALVAFRREGDSSGARAQLALAVGANRHVAKFLTGEREIASVPLSYRPGTIAEAEICANWLADTWMATPGAVAWLESQQRAPASRSGRSRPRRRP